MLWMLALVALRLTDIPPSLRHLLPGDFPAYLRQIEAESARRLGEGEFDHLVYYVLQSRQFTTAAPIEPARSAREFIATGTIPPPVARRAAAFLTAPPTGSRMTYLRSLVRTEDEILREYRRAMRFLYDKEFASRAKQGDARRRYIASLYETRGHSSDTSLEASFSVHQALATLKQLAPDFHVEKALVVGPGLDFAPRTALSEESEPQSYQPFLLLDSLRRLGLSKNNSTVECFDLNPRVVGYFASRPTRLNFHWQPEGNEQSEFLNQARTATLPAITAIRGNLLTHHTSETYDLIVATNILLYFDQPQLLLAMTNLRAMLRPGGILLHNDPRPEIEQYAAALHLPILNAQMIRLSQKRSLFDTIILHRLPI